MAAVNIWTQRTLASSSTFNIDEADGITSITILVTGTGTVATTILGTLDVDGNASATIDVNTRETITIDAGNGRVLDGITIVTSSDLDTFLIGRQ